MDNTIEVVTLLHQQSELEMEIIHGDGSAAATDYALEATQRRLVSADAGGQVALPVKALSG